jgi:hypothetical protein
LQRPKKEEEAGAEVSTTDEATSGSFIGRKLLVIAPSGG